MDEIAQKTCECLENVSDSLNADDFSMKVGLCMIDVASPYKKQLKKDYGIDFNNIETEGEELGRLIGMKMVGFCPEALMRMASKINDEDELELDEPANEQVKTYTGVITKVEVSQFVVFTVKNSNGKLSKFYWLNFIDSNRELTADYEAFEGGFTIISYESQEFFDPRIGEYRMFNIIKKLDISEE